MAAIVALSSCAAPSTATQPAGASGDFAQQVAIGGGRHLFPECRGQGTPTIVLESGYHDSSDPWSLTDATNPAVGPAVLPGLAATHQVCAYDRPGTLRYAHSVAITDRSSLVPMPRTAVDVVSDLHAVLAAAQVPGPYVLVAHSMGELCARLYAQTYPDQVRALLFVDSFPVEIPRCRWASNGRATSNTAGPRAPGRRRRLRRSTRHFRRTRADVFVETKIWISDYGYDQTLYGFDKAAASSASTRPQAAGSGASHIGSPTPILAVLHPGAPTGRADPPAASRRTG